MMRVRATADNLLAWATPMTASPISGAHSEIGLIESAYEPNNSESDRQHPYKANVFQGAELCGRRGGARESGGLAGVAGVRVEYSLVEGSRPSQMSCPQIAT